MRTTGMSFKAIGRQMGYHYTVVSRLVRKHTQTNNSLLFTLQAHRACKFKYLQAHHQFYRPEFENYINDHKIIKPPKFKT
jgi:hypothetical protein